MSRLCAGRDRHRYVLGDLAAHKLTNRRVTFVLGPRLIVLLPSDQAQVARETNGSIVARMCRLMVKARLGQGVGQHPFVVHVWPFVERSATTCLAAHETLFEIGKCRVRLQMCLDGRAVQAQQSIKQL